MIESYFDNDESDEDSEVRERQFDHFCVSSSSRAVMMTAVNGKNFLPKFDLISHSLYLKFSAQNALRMFN